MRTQFNSFITKTSSLKSIIYLFLASHGVLLIMMISTFPIINNEIGSTAFDLRTFGYSVSDAQSIVRSLSPQTSDLYLFPQLLLLDVLYPVLLALFLSSLLCRLGRLGGISIKLISVLMLIPFLAMAFDYLENLCIILMITGSVEASEFIVNLSSSFTVLKGGFTSIAWIGILGFSVVWALGRRPGLRAGM